MRTVAAVPGTAEGAVAVGGVLAHGNGHLRYEETCGWRRGRNLEGVAPGQACVFYDAPSGQARVLGGGFIQSAAATRASHTRPLAEAVRG